MQPAKNMFAGIAVVALAAGLAAGTPGTAHATDATTVAVPNASFEEGWLNKKLKCWNVDRPDAGKLTLTQNAHSGSWAASLTGAATSTGRLTLATDRTDACAVPVVAGRGYDLRFWARSNAEVQPVVAAWSPTAGWSTWHTGTPFAASTALVHRTVALPAVPAGVTKISVGLSVAGNRTVVLDDVSLTGRTAAPVTADPALFRAAFTASGLATNEFAYWNPASPLRVSSADWEMTSGSLFHRDGAGWTGPVDAILPDALSANGTDSAIFRLNTRAHSFADVRVSMNLNLARLTTTSRTPATSWDGVHIFLHYQSQYELYYASVARRDGHVVIKKKCLGGPSNGGAYHVLPNSEKSGLSLPLGSWQSVGAAIRTNADGSVTIAVHRGGKVVSTATDTGIGCAPIRAAGASGIRGDNAEFRFADFTVTADN